VPPAKKYYLSECVQAYAPQDEQERVRLEDFLKEPKREGAKTMVKTAYERGREEGIEEGIEKGIEKGIERGMRNGRIRMLIQILEKRFRTTLAPQVKQRMSQWSDDQVQAILDKLFATESLQDLGLDE
jgi:flagellar biosynthesis/type III secretory pathway protein FliH